MALIPWVLCGLAWFPMPHGRNEGLSADVTLSPRVLLSVISASTCAFVLFLNMLAKNVGHCYGGCRGVESRV